MKMSDLALSLGRIVVMLAAAYAIIAVLGHFYSLRAMFPRPAPSYTMTPDYFHLTAPDGVKLAARHWETPGASHTVLWFHGNGEDLGTVGDYIGEWQKLGLSVFAVDYRGYGGSGGSPTEGNVNADAALALEWLKREKKLKPEQLIIFGYSLGSGPAVDLAVREEIAGLILLAPFVSAYRVMTGVPLLPGDKFRNLSKMPRVRCPVLVIQGTDDGMIPVWHGRKIYEAAPGPKRSLWVEGADHGDVSEVAGERYWETIKSFAESL